MKYKLINGLNCKENANSMVINFSIKYSTSYGEQISIMYAQDSRDEQRIFPLNYLDKNLWIGSLVVNEKEINEEIVYEVVLRKEENLFEKIVLAKATLNISKHKKRSFNIIHENFPLKDFIRIDKAKPFKTVFKPENHKKVKSGTPKNVTHIFEIESPFLQDSTYVCLTGSGKKMNDFDNTKPLLFKKKHNNKSAIELDLSDENFPLEYKIGIYDCNKKLITEYEPGVNHILPDKEKEDVISIIHLNHSFTNHAWKGAGINVPIFSLRTERGWGTGDFTDIHLLVDYAASIGMKLIQLLPINDTTGHYTDKDSYPYSAISSFGLHPKFLNVRKMAHAASIAITNDEQKEIDRLNALSFSDHSGVLALKIAVLKRIFEIQKADFKNDMAWFSFFDLNRNWLVPFAAFCVLRDKYKTPDFTKWEEYAEYNEDKIQAFASVESKDYEAILFWYYVQFHLHLQLQDAIEYAHKKGVVLKADLPIGVGRLSADTWANPSLFVMEMQAGAPPDAFSASGQNWSFPTYNIEQMALDGFAWFRKRMEHLHTYFDAVRIDHVLGIFRIWSIPLNQVDGTMGRFVPAIAMPREVFNHAGLHFDDYRFCEPFITEEILYESFGEDTNQVKEIFLKEGRLAVAFDDQKKIAAYFIHSPENIKWQQGLFDIVSNVLLFKVEEGYHFRINMFQISSYKALSAHEKSLIDTLYHHYFFEMQNDLWRHEGELKLQMLTDSTDMLLCAEDLGMVPDFTDEVLKNLDILSLQVQQMPKDSASSFSDTAKAKYESVVMPATHDMPTIRLWWEENRDTAQLLFNQILDEHGTAPYYCEPWVCRKIFEKHMQSPAMWSIFLMQDLLAINGKIRLENPAEERINNPSNPDHVWNYRMHISLETLMEETAFNEDLKNMIQSNGR